MIVFLFWYFWINMVVLEIKCDRCYYHDYAFNCIITARNISDEPVLRYYKMDYKVQKLYFSTWQLQYLIVTFLRKLLTWRCFEIHVQNVMVKVAPIYCEFKLEKFTLTLWKLQFRFSVYRRFWVGPSWRQSMVTTYSGYVETRTWLVLEGSQGAKCWEGGGRACIPISSCCSVC
jgi:hypothetical protein